MVKFFLVYIRITILCHLNLILLQFHNLARVFGNLTIPSLMIILFVLSFDLLFINMSGFKHVFSSVKEFWESLKNAVKSETIKFLIQKKKSHYFFKLEQQRFVKSRISSIYNSDEVQVFTHEEIMKAHVDFYANLLSWDVVNESIELDLLSNVSCRLSNVDRASCEGNLSLEEATDAVNAMRNKSPGLDGLISEFFKTFWGPTGSIAC